MLLGVRAHDFGRLPVEEHARLISSKGFKAIQLAPAKAIADFNTQAEVLDAGFARHIAGVLRDHDLHVAVLGCYINPVHPYEAERSRQLDHFKDHIRRARDFGCNVVGTETGSLNADLSYNPDNHGDRAFETLVESIAGLVEEAEKYDVFIGIEGVAKYVAYSPGRIKKLIACIGSDHLKVILDPVNLLTINNYQSQDDLIIESFELLGDRIEALHAKDFLIENGRLRSVQAGRGSLNYGLIFRLMKQYKPEGYVLMEDTCPQYIDEGIRYLEEILQRV